MGASALLLLFETSETCGVFLASVLCAQWYYLNNGTSGVSLKKSITNFRFFFVLAIHFWSLKNSLSQCIIIQFK